MHSSSSFKSTCLLLSKAPVFYTLVDRGIFPFYSQMSFDQPATTRASQTASATPSTVLHPKRRILIAATGSVASVKIPIIVKTLIEEVGDLVEVKVVSTDAALHFFKREDVLAEVLTDHDEWATWGKMSDPVMHIELRNWADMIIICPLDANTLAKLAQGLCDNLITCILRAWDEKKPVIVCPAMNTNMWNHKFTAMHLSTLTDLLQYRVVPPISKLLACGDLGVGAMAEYRTIVDAIKTEVDSMRVSEV